MAHTATTNPTPQELGAARVSASVDVASGIDVSGNAVGMNASSGAEPVAPAMATATGGGGTTTTLGIGESGAAGEGAAGGGGGGGGATTHGNNLTTTDPMQRPADAALSEQKVRDEMLIKKIVNQAVQDTIQDESYSHDATRVWSNRIVESLVRTLVQMDRDNKYIVTCMIVQNLRQGMRSATSCFWNAQTDSGYSLTNERNGMYVITTVFICKA